VRAYGFTKVGGPDTQSFLDVAVPEPDRDELLVRVRAAAVNPGDWRVREGAHGHNGPTVLGREVAGTVVALGPGVTGFAVGDEVFGGCPGMVGGWAEQALITASFTAHRPPDVRPELAAALPVASATAFDAMERFGLDGGSTLLVNGAGGGVGIAAVQLATARGLRVIGVASPAKQDLVAELGAVPVSYGDGIIERVRSIVPDGVDAVLDMAGGDPLRTVASLLRRPTQLTSIADKALAVQLGGFELVRDRSTRVLEHLVQLVSAGTLDPHVTEIRPLSDAPAALALVESGHATGKVVLVP
jgi:NADPH2:quinone reductase